MKEDWKSQPGSVVVSFRLGNERHQLVLAEDDDWINPFVVTSLNNLLPNDGPSFFFVDNGGQMALVTRATERWRNCVRCGCCPNPRTGGSPWESGLAEGLKARGAQLAHRIAGFLSDAQTSLVP